MAKPSSQSRDGLRASHAWIMEHGGEYRGFWVVVCNGKLLGAARDLEQLKPMLEGALVAHMPSASHWYEGGDMYEYVALSWRTLAWCDDKSFVPSHARLREEGWEEYIRAYFENDIGGACIMRRPKDEPRKWTRVELIGLIKRLVISELDYGDPRGIPGSVLNECVTQADLCGRLERRNAELQAAIDAVVQTYESVAYKLDPVCRSIKEHLYLLASSSVKEESNG